MKIAIHQPNFMPWYPFFQKVESADIFVILSNCQFEKNNFQNRFNIDDRWYTMSTNKGLELISKKEYVTPKRDWIKIKKSLYNYNLDCFDDCISSSLLKTNSMIIERICKMLDINTRIVYDYATDLKGTERLLDLCKYFKGNCYISGISGKQYMNTKLFEDNNIDLLFQGEDSMVKSPILKILKEKGHV